MVIAKSMLVTLVVTTCLIVSTVPAYAAQQVNVLQGDASLNWSGYVAKSSGTATNSYTSVTGTWTVPSVSAATSGTADATWVGIGGVQSSDLIQAGTQAVVQNGTVSYSAWIETLPGYSKTVLLAVHSGDSVTTTLTQVSAGVWHITIQNNTQGTSYSRTVSYNSSLSSAEWVEEMVSNGDGSFRPLDSFGTVGFTGLSATVNGTSENLFQLGATPLQMVSAHASLLASASAIGSDNASFSVARGNTSAIADVQQPVSTIAFVRRRHGYRSGGYNNSSILPGGSTFTIVRL